MALDDWDWRLPVDLQDYAWDCAACSTAWAMRTVGYNYSEADVIRGLGPSRISPSLGLLDASGAGLVEYLGEQGILSDYNPDASWEEVCAAAGSQPMVIGGRTWYHWVGVRLLTPPVGLEGEPVLALANPAPGWMDVTQYLTEQNFYDLGSFSAVWFTAW